MSTYFKERQQYRNRIVLIIFGAIALVVMLKGIHFLRIPEPNYVNAIFLFLVTLIIGGIMWWYAHLKLKVVITDKNIKYKMSPIHEKKQVIPWKEVEKYEIVKTSEAAQWSGGNITFNHEKRFSLTGRNGLAIKTKDEKYYFIGCKNIAELQMALKQLNFK